LKVKVEAFAMWLWWKTNKNGSFKG
jgi:hypothetical protein